MSSGVGNQPRILRGAFVEYGLSIPPLIVPFQFNPVQLARNRSLSYAVPGETPTESVPGETEEPKKPKVSARLTSLRQFHGRAEFADLDKLQESQVVNVQEESISFEVRLDATDKLNEGDAITQQFGIAPQLATLELMVYPKSESLAGQLLGRLAPGGFSFTRGKNPPMILFIWGRKKVLPVNITSMNVTETEFNTDLNPTRATVAVNLAVIEGASAFYLYSKAMKEAMSALNLANVAAISDVVIPG